MKANIDSKYYIAYKPVNSINKMVVCVKISLSMEYYK